METKKCVTCEEVKSINEFYLQKRYSKKSGHCVYVPPECKTCTKARSLGWRRANKDQVNELARSYNPKDSYRESRKRAAAKRVQNGKYQQWQKDNPDKIKQYRSNHNKHEITSVEWEACKIYFNNSCAYCGKKQEEHFVTYAGELKISDLHKEHVDHEGANDLSNCVPACRSCNSSKNTFTLDEWYVPEKDFYSKRRLSKIHKWISKDFLEFIKIKQN